MTTADVKTFEFKNALFEGRMPVLGLGTWKSKPGEVKAAVKEAIRVGYRHIDCAPIYGNEAEVGEAIRELLDEGKVGREDLWVTSKLWNSFHLPEDVPVGLDQTLSDLQLDYLDLYLIHWPVALKKGVHLPQSGDDFLSLKDCPISDTWQAMEQQVKSGKCRFIGVSNFSQLKILSLLKTATVKPVMNQIEMHPYLQQPGMLEFCHENNIHLTAYSPLGSNDRPANRKKADEKLILEEPVILDIARRHDVTPAQVLVQWAIARGTAVVPKSVTPHRIAENLASKDLLLDEADMNAINALDRHQRYLDGSFWDMPGNDYTYAELWDES